MRPVLRCRPLHHLLCLRAARLHSFSPAHLLPSAFGTAGFGPSLPAIWFPRRSRRGPVSHRDFGLGLSIQLEHSHPSKIGLESVFTFKFPTANLSQVPVFRQTTRIHVKPYSSVSAAFSTKTTWYKPFLLCRALILSHSHTEDGASRRSLLPRCACPGTGHA
ncbi:hypothetical protein EV421DRAFT_1859203 [Armillaria borealis]|uniref:Uncharacterized protein n=1 Tax=Armillaria borealis TaxID=47425 RepID=A0AA39ITT1_9AGAR|nr:hypothetical protein EV421DRAFT_1859203 [Armillaria borealis]